MIILSRKKKIHQVGASILIEAPEALRFLEEGRWVEKFPDGCPEEFFDPFLEGTLQQTNHGNRKSTFSNREYIFIHVGFSIAMLVYWRVSNFNFPNERSVVEFIQVVFPLGFRERIPKNYGFAGLQFTECRMKFPIHDFLAARSPFYSTEDRIGGKGSQANTVALPIRPLT